MIFSGDPRRDAELLNRMFMFSTGNPNGVVSASVGAICINVNGTAGSTFYVKESGTGNTGWNPK